MLDQVLPSPVQSLGLSAKKRCDVFGKFLDIRVAREGPVGWGIAHRVIHQCVDNKDHGCGSLFDRLGFVA